MRSIDLFGNRSLHIQLSSEPDRWRTDPLDGREYPAVCSARISLVEPDRDGDIRTVWEVNRLQHLITAVTRRPEAEVAQRALDEVRDWVACNPINVGPNWTCAMETAIRLANIVVLSELGEALTRRDWTSELAATVGEHTLHILGNLEKSDLHGNHYIADLAGLVAAAWFYRETWQGRSLARFARRELTREASFQLRPDGAPRDGTIAYHVLVVEHYLFSIGRLGQLGYPLPEWVRDRVSTCVGVTRTLVEGHDRLPWIGDADDGRLLRFATSNHEEILDLLWNRSDERPSYRQIAFGIEPTPDRFGPGAPQAGPSACSADGFVALRAGPTAVALRAGGEAFPMRSHAHADDLSVVVSMAGRPIVIDPGHPRYGDGRAERARAIGLDAHNVPVPNSTAGHLAGSGIGSIVPSRARLQSVRSTASEASCEGVSFIDGRTGLLVNRTVALDRAGVVTLTDRLEAAGMLLVRWQFSLGPGLDAQLIGNEQRHSEVSIAASDGSLVATLSVAPEDQTKVNLGRQRVWQGYGDPAEAAVIVIEAGPSVPAETIISLEPAGAHSLKPDSSSAKPAGGPSR